MAWYYGTYSCGHEGRTNIIGPTRNRQWIADRHFDKMCTECYQAHLEEQREAERLEASQKATEMELPDLTGTEKQVAWAVVIRQSLIDACDKLLELHPRERDQIIHTLQHVLQSNTSASYYIDNRFLSAEEWLTRARRTMPTNDMVVQETEIQKLEAEATIYPQKTKTELVAKITVLEGDIIEVRYPEKYDILRDAVRGLDFVWSEGRWARRIGTFSGPITDRAAEVASQLLNKGIPVCVMDETVRNMAISGEYEPECKSWVAKRATGKYDGWFMISWDRTGTNFYNAARAIAGSRYEKPNVVVPRDSYLEILDFVEMYGFKLSEGAQGLVKEAEELRSRALTMTPQVRNVPTVRPLDEPPKLDIPGEVEIDEELLDND